MDPRLVRELLERVRASDVSVDEALESLRQLPFRDLGFAVVDHHRALRQGVPEVIFGERKTAEQIALIAEEITKNGNNVLVTRVDEAKAAAVLARAPFHGVPRMDPGAPGAEEAAEIAPPRVRHSKLARTISVEVAPIPRRDKGPVVVLAAGTSDLDVAEEAAETLRAIGLEVRRIYDVGVAGLHRFLHRVEDLRQAAAVIVCAGMEGALPSVVGGVVSAPVVAVPTSVGYGTALGGFTPLFAMLTSCASGVVVVNIDNGFGAAMAVHRMLRG